MRSLRIESSAIIAHWALTSYSGTLLYVVNRWREHVAGKSDSH